MAEITQEITEYAGDAPNRNTQTNTVFSANADFFAGYFSAVPPEYNTFATQTNAVAIEVNANATTAANAATAAASSANFIGIWDDLTGSAAIGDGVSHDSAQWRTAVAIADITLSEPSASNADWVFVSGNTWLKVTASMDAIPNSKIQVSATSAPVDIQLVNMSVGDSFSMRNNSNSTEIVRLLNSTYTIIGSSGTITSSDNLVFRPKETRIFICRDTNVLEIL